MEFKRSDVTLANWRATPHSRWSFQNVSEIVPSAIITAAGQPNERACPLGDLSGLALSEMDTTALPLEAFLEASETDELVIMRQGRIVAEWSAAHRNPAQPHIIFSVSKSLTGLLTGILASKGLLSFDRLIIDYVPEVAGSAYADATLQQLFDMEVSSDFVEDYLDRNDGFDRYRRATGWNPVNSDDPVPDLKSFLCTIAKGDGEHGEKHAYRSPNTDLAGIVLERAGGRRFASLMGEHLWRPMGARSDAMVTVDRIGTARAAGGISATARDLARVGELVRTGGGGIVAEPFIASLWTAGDRQAWKKGDQATLFPEGSYRNYWYETGRGEIAAIGIHGQWIWIDPLYETVIVKVSSQEKPVDSQLDQAIIRVLRAICQST